MKYYKGFYFKGADEDTEIAKITSTTEERKRVLRIILSDFETDFGSIVSVKVEREYVMENYRTKGISTYIEHVFEIGLDLAVGEALTVWAKNISVGNDSLIQGHIEYEILK